jgi:hypothetical protein
MLMMMMAVWRRSLMVIEWFAVVYGGGVVVECVGCGGEERKREGKLVRGEVRRLLEWLEWWRKLLDGGERRWLGRRELVRGEGKLREK